MLVPLGYGMSKIIKILLCNFEVSFKKCMPYKGHVRTFVSLMSEQNSYHVMEFLF